MSELNASNFKSNKIQTLTQKRVEMIMAYIIYCYQKMLSENITYSKSTSLNASGGMNNLEVYLNEMLVIDYLSKSFNVEYYKNEISDNSYVNIIFNNESKQTYDDKEGVRRNDFIDIKINESIVQDIWNKQTSDQIHLAIECKLIESGYSEYVSDIEKMCERSYNTKRLPFEGQIGYIINSSYDHIKVKKGVNKSLKSNRNIVTTKELEYQKIHSSFPGSYKSDHKRNYSINEQFRIYHLLFNYSSIVIN